ncbi:MAG: HlyC/CorC family transporter [Microscillaceae bacterium]|nr:HlyC/CorC family transporter [Microscillaceae bacterium]
MEYHELLAIVISLLLSAFFSGSEIAFVSANRLYFELQKKQGVLSGRILSGFFQKPSQLIASLLVGNTITLVVYGIYMANILEPIIAARLPQQINSDLTVLVVQSVFSTILVLITAEFLPKALFLLNPDRFLEILAIPILIFYWFLFAIVFIIVGLSRGIIVHVFKLDYSEDKPVFSLVDLHKYISNTQPTPDTPAEPEVDPKIFARAILFKNVRVRDCMIPRTEIVAVEADDPIDKLRQAFINSGHSKILVYQESIDEIIGYCHSLDLFSRPTQIRDIITEIIIVPGATPAQELLVRFINERKSLALVIDEFGGTEGLVSIEDVVEEIFGEIQDEYDQEDWVELKINDHTFTFSARHEIDYLNERYQLNLPTGDYDTLGGYILSIYENIPRENDVIEVPPYSFTIIGVQHARIDTVRLSIDPQVMRPK